MGEGSSLPGGDAVTDAVGTAGLFLIVTAVIASALGFADFGLARGGWAVTAVIIAMLSFGGSIVCFLGESRRLGKRERLAGAEGPVPGDAYFSE